MFCLTKQETLATLFAWLWAQNKSCREFHVEQKLFLCQVMKMCGKCSKSSLNAVLKCFSALRIFSKPVFHVPIAWHDMLSDFCVTTRETPNVKVVNNPMRNTMSNFGLNPKCFDKVLTSTLLGDELTDSG